MPPSNLPRQRQITGIQRNGSTNSPSRIQSANEPETVQNGNLTRSTSTSSRVAVVGGGLVGSMMSCFLARRGYQVDLFEMRSDPRNAVHVVGKSINLALSERGRSALRSLGLEETILKDYSIKMHSRMIHNKDGTKRAIPYGTKSDQCILSVSRRFLNELLITEAEKYSNTNVYFNHKLVGADLENGLLTFQNESIKNIDPSEDANEMNQESWQEIKADVILGCDGAYSAVRRHMIKLLLLDYSQKYIEHGYLELSIPPTESGDFAMEANYLHIWPRGHFMMIALPNLDRSFTVTLFMPFKIYEEINDETKLYRFFEDNFADSLSLLTKQGLSKTFFSNKPSPLISIKCKPYNYKEKVLLMGDAAHAMVPFYGQGMNCGFEDCIVLEELLSNYGNNNLSSVLEKFTTKRVENCHSIIDLAMYNYVEMRDLVNRKTFLIRKYFDNWMYSLFPSLWVPLYTMVTFTRIPYKRCMDDRRWQDNLLKQFFKVMLVIFGIISFVQISRMLDQNPTIHKK